MNRILALITLAAAVVLGSKAGEMAAEIAPDNERCLLAFRFSADFGNSLYKRCEKNPFMGEGSLAAGDWLVGVDSTENPNTQSYASGELYFRDPVLLAQATRSVGWGCLKATGFKTSDNRFLFGNFKMENVNS